MTDPDPIAARYAQIARAFDADGFDVKPTPDPANPSKLVAYQVKDGCVGVLAVSKTAKNGVTGAPKKAIYVEGDNLQMGWLLGVLAEPDVARMTTEFAQKIAFAFVHLTDIEHSTAPLAVALKELVVDIVFELSQSMKADIPAEYVEEMQGIVDGCRAANPETKVVWKDLWALNCGVDCLLAHVYSGKLFAERSIPPALLRVPLMCNAVFLSGAATGGKNLFGRDFMFSTAGVFQDTACMIIARPSARDGKPRRAIVSQTAPGFVGSVTVLNDAGVALGVDMLPSGLCDPDRPGLNSLLLVRDCGQWSSTAVEAVDRITAAPRGVSWIYPVADRTGRACIVEAGRAVPEGEPFPYFDGVPSTYREHLPTVDYIEAQRAKHGTPAPQRGLMTRWNDYRYPDDYLAWNEGLWGAFSRSAPHRIAEIMAAIAVDLAKLGAGDLPGLLSAIEAQVRQWFAGVPYDPSAFGPTSFIDPLWTDRNCPASFYFAPQRASHGDTLVATNHAVTPEMRLTMMSEWNALLTGPQFDDMQWRYDQLNLRVREAIAAGPIDWSSAWALANFLRPGPYPLQPESTYHGGGTPDWQQVTVTGSVSLCDLDEARIRSLFGYYGDEPVTITLPRYLEGSSAAP
ncbi:MAG: hypothetical protein HYV09_40080 [Deltaproteobacteria bacterium]|nr:hypothetical protein [Deltaproteobacteria bacterium]